MSSLSQLTPGTIFAKDFRVIRPLREGGMGAVYIAEQVSTGRQRALKLMSPDLVNNPEIRQRFVREAKIAANIESDHVVETVTAGVDEATGAPYLVMELLRGEELADALSRSGPLAFDDLKEVFTQIGHALEQAHAQGVVHRDLKPENIFLAASKRRDAAFTAKILDFGIAKLVADGIQKTGTQPLGSPLFMAPEQTDRKGRVCPATDVWALGLMAFYLLTGKSYWVEADGGSLPGLLREICIEPIVSASQRAQELGVPANVLPHGFDAWFAKCVDRDVDARFQEGGAAVQAFTHLVPTIASGEQRRLKLATITLENLSAPINMMTSAAVAATALLDQTGQANASAASLAATGGGTTGGMGNSQISLLPQPAKRFPWIIVIAVGALAAGGGTFLAVSASKTTTPANGTATASAGTTATTTAETASASASASATAGDLNSCPAGMTFHPKGTTHMGSKSLPDYAGAKIAGRKVTVSSFCIDTTEVTVDAYEQCIAGTTCERTADDVNYSDSLTPALKALYRPFCNARKPERGSHPINCVSFKMAETFCKWKNLRLPTEAEWEFAARGKGQVDYPWGHEAPDATRLNAAGTEFRDWAIKNSVSDRNVMYEADDKFVGTAPVGSFPAGKSSYGVLDLAGNVWEWTTDYYGEYASGEFTDPKGTPSGIQRVIRGGSFNGSDPQWANPAWRFKMEPERYSFAIGFRCASSAN